MHSHVTKRSISEKADFGTQVPFSFYLFSFTRAKNERSAHERIRDAARLVVGENYVAERK